MAKIKVAIIGVGNCAASLVQGIEYYKNAKDEDFIPGLMHVNLGGYHISDIEFSTAFDIAKNKVGKDLSEAIHAKPNNAAVFAKVPSLGIKVHRGMTHDGLGKYLSRIIKEAPGKTDDVSGILKETKTDIVINYLPVGSEEATKWYVEQVLNAGCAFINCIPVFIAREEYWQNRFKEKGLPIIGDDIKSQVGATILHRVLTNLFLDRGMPVDHTYQLNTGGNTDFLNMKEEGRLISKKISKTHAVVSQIQNRGLTIDKEDVHIGPSDYVPWQKDNKLCFLRIESRHFGNLPMNLECRLSVEDSPNSAGVVIDAIRCAKIALNNGISGALLGPSAYFKKSPPVQYDDNTARKMVEDFIATYRGEKGKSKKTKALKNKKGKSKKKGTSG
ncbi:MAG: inositol-3-phosphate synthase [Candidatus Makaraimicrobium thalassicum]|nr:MAG: inositol-3-phosphate synthase [Candidatus Omnitrophota bacterium]